MGKVRVKKIPTSSLQKGVILMPTPPKPFTVLTTEKKSHRTKAELELRKTGEESLASGVAMKERSITKKNEIAHKEFQRINKLLKVIKKNDALYEAIINRYAILQAECVEFEEKRERLYEIVIKLDSAFDAEIDKTPDEEKGKVIKQYSKNYNDTIKSLLSIDSQVQLKRKMLLDIEKENIMTIASALRSIPKKVEEEEEDPMANLLSRKRM
jgi:hypothetical protein